MFCCYPLHISSYPITICFRYLCWNGLFKNLLIVQLIIFLVVFFQSAFFFRLRLAMGSSVTSVHASVHMCTALNWMHYLQERMRESELHVTRAPAYKCFFLWAQHRSCDWGNAQHHIEYKAQYTKIEKPKTIARTTRHQSKHNTCFICCIWAETGESQTLRVSHNTWKH